MSDTTTQRPMTGLLCQRIAALLDLSGKRVRFLDVHGMEVEGTIRGLRSAQDMDSYPGRDQDVRDTWVRVTTVSGWEWWYRTLDLADALANGALMEVTR
jgi:hypothetical protein